jgi:hypothetical protein
MVFATEAENVRGRRNPQITMVTFIDPEERVPTAYPLRTIKRLTDEALADPTMTFDQMYAENRWPPIPPERRSASEAQTKRRYIPRPIVLANSDASRALMSRSDTKTLGRPSSNGTHESPPSSLRSTPDMVET